MKRRWLIALLLFVISVTLCFLSGCSNVPDSSSNIDQNTVEPISTVNTVTEEQTAEEASIATETPEATASAPVATVSNGIPAFTYDDEEFSSTTIIPTDTPMPTITPVPTATPIPEATPEPTPTPVPTLSPTQKNSINMLNYLVVFTQEVNASKNSRMFLENAYSTLHNNTNPGAVDEGTQSEINYLFNTIAGYRMLSIKRDHLKIIYEQNKAQAIRNAIPNPVGLLSAVQSLNPTKLIASIAYMAIDSIASYESSMSAAEQQFLKDGWELDEKQDEKLYDIRQGTFNYMVEEVREHKLDGLLTLNELAVENYVAWKEKNVQQRIQYFESNEAIYKAYGPYWLTLAESYYEVGDYEKCLAAVETYEALDVHIFRFDHDLAKTLTFAIAAAHESLSEEAYIDLATRYCETIMANTVDDEWDLRYFVAQIYIDLFSKTADASYLESAYNIALNNANWLYDEQIKLNDTYLADVVDAKLPEKPSDAEKKDADEYNKMIREQRKTELPPAYEPLIVNCELLSALANKLEVPTEKRNYLDGIIHPDGKDTFLTVPLDKAYRFSSDTSFDISSMDVSFDGKTLKLPAILVSPNYEITVSILRDGVTTRFTDWTVANVDRKVKSDLNSFVATFNSSEIQSYGYQGGEMIEISIVPHTTCKDDPVLLHFEVKKNMILFIPDYVFTRSE